MVLVHCVSVSSQEQKRRERENLCPHPYVSDSIENIQLAY